MSYELLTHNLSYALTFLSFYNLIILILNMTRRYWRSLNLLHLSYPLVIVPILTPHLRRAASYCDSTPLPYPNSEIITRTISSPTWKLRV